MVSAGFSYCLFVSSAVNISSPVAFSLTAKAGEAATSSVLPFSSGGVTMNVTGSPSNMGLGAVHSRNGGVVGTYCKVVIKICEG